MIGRHAYSYSATIKSDLSDELINTYLIRPIAGIAVRILYRTPLLPNHVTLAATAAGILAAFFYLDGTAAMNIAGGLCLTAKDILDSADGQLARAKKHFSRAGRFLDSIGDFIVNLLVFGAIGYALFTASNDRFVLLLALTGFAGTTLRVSYHVFYQTSYLHQHALYHSNRTTEEIRPEDFSQAWGALQLQRLFQLIYGRQDRWMVAIDAWCKAGLQKTKENDERWYGDRMGLRISGFLGLGTELFVLMIFSVSNQLEAYLVVNAVAMNVVWLASVLYRRTVLARRVMHHSSR